MGKKENPLLAYYNQEERFAQLMNGWLFGGKTYLKAENISEADRRLEGRSGKSREYRYRERDVFKKADNALIRLYIGAELMEYVDYAMPLRVLDCDVLSYLRQEKAIAKRHMEQKDLSSQEYLSRISRRDRLLPVITLILYCGERAWDGAKCLHDMLDLHKIPEELRQYVGDYSLHVLDVRHTPDERLREFPQDICFMLMCIKYSKDKEAFLHLKELTGCAAVGKDTFQMIAEYLQEPKLLEREGKVEEGGEVNMCEAIQALVEDGKREGRKEGLVQGERSGVELAKHIFRLARAGMSVQEIAEKLSISEEKVEWVLE